MASSAQLLTIESINADPWGALKVAVYDNPTQLSAAIQSVIGQPVPNDGPNLYAFIVDYFNENGDIDPFITAAQNVSMSSPRNTSAKDSTFNWGGLLGGVFSGIGAALGGIGGNANQPNQQALLIAQQQAEAQRRTTTTILIVVGIVVAAVVAIVIFRKK